MDSNLWAIGVQTCNRNENYLNHSLESVSRGGWDHLTIFADYESNISSNYPINYRPYQFGDWSNWICGLFELYVLNPKANYFLMFEDDITCCKNLKTYLEWAIPRLGDFGCLSLYTPNRYKKEIDCWHDESDADWALVGGQAILFTRKSLKRFLSNEKILNYSELSNIAKDRAIGIWAFKQETVLYHTPSLVNHCGENSTTGSIMHKSIDYVGDDFDANSLINQQIKIIPAKSKLF